MQRWVAREHRWTSASVCFVQNHRRTTPSTWLMTRIGPRSCLPNGLSQRPHKILKNINIVISKSTKFKVSHNIYHINTSCCTRLQPSFAWFATSSTSNPGCQSAYHQRPGILCLAKKSMRFHVVSSNLMWIFDIHHPERKVKTGALSGFHGTSIWWPHLSDLLSWSSRCKVPRRPQVSVSKFGFLGKHKQVIACAIKSICNQFDQICWKFLKTSIEGKVMSLWSVKSTSVNLKLGSVHAKCHADWRDNATSRELAKGPHLDHNFCDFLSPRDMLCSAMLWWLCLQRLLEDSHSTSNPQWVDSSHWTPSVFEWTLCNLRI